jgi:hypothetical protein
MGFWCYWRLNSSLALAWQVFYFVRNISSLCLVRFLLVSLFVFSFDWWCQNLNLIGAVALSRQVLYDLSQAFSLNLGTTP